MLYSTSDMYARTLLNEELFNFTLQPSVRGAIQETDLLTEAGPPSSASSR